MSGSLHRSFDFVLHTDGACLGNPGPMGLGIVIENSSGKVIEELSIPHGRGTNNQAELSAILRGLEHVSTIGKKTSQVQVQMDSEWACKILNQEYKLKAEALRPIVDAIRKVEGQLGKVTYEWIPREANERADFLSKQAAEHVVEEEMVGKKK